MTVRELTRDDPEFPRDLLLVQEDPVTRLFAEGDLSLLKRPRVAIIGSRHPSTYGIRVAYEAAKALAAQGVVVVSGMAIGLDARAHRGALDAGGGTIAVLGTGIDVDYPATNRALLADVRSRGLVLAEKPAGIEPRHWNFPARNRIIAALGRCLLVVEGKVKGGTSNTVKWAAGLGRPVFGVPGHLGDPLAESPNFLIRDGGTIYTSPNDILLSIGLPAVPEDRSRTALREAAETASLARASLTGAEATLFDLIGPDPVQVDTLAVKSELDPGLLLAALSSLELQGLVTQLPGKQFVLAA